MLNSSFLLYDTSYKMYATHIQDVLDTTMHKQTQIAWALLQTNVGKNDPKIVLCWKRSGHHNPEIKKVKLYDMA